MGLEQRINQRLNRYPMLKRVIKSTYQHIMCAISQKKKCEGAIFRLSPNDPDHEYFFGYYDKSPWDATGRYVLCLKAKDTWSNVAPKESADILLIDTQEENRVTKIATTHSWNVQQGCMMQWLGPDFCTNIIYNDYRDDNFCSVILNIKTGEKRLLRAPIYTVSEDGKTALTLDFCRLHRLRPGYGYSNREDSTKNEKLPNRYCIWKLDLEKDELTPLLKYTDFAAFEPRKDMINAEHKVNHLMISPNGKRFMVIHRWFNGKRKYSRLITVNMDGTEMYNLSDDDMVSHCYWKDDKNIIAFENKRETGIGYYLEQDRTPNYKRLWPEISCDGHPSYSPNKELIVTDTYPNRSRIASLMIMDENSYKTIAKVFAPFKYDNDTRCDLHPRWSRNGKQICFDGVFEGHRGLYAINL